MFEGKSVKLKLTIFVTNIEIFKVDKLNIHVFVFFNFWALKICTKLSKIPLCYEFILEKFIIEKINLENF